MPKMKGEIGLPERSTLEVGVTPDLDAVKRIVNMLLADTSVTEQRL